MQHRQQGNRHNRGQRRDRTREPHPHAGQRRPTNTRNGDKNTRSGEKCGRCGGYQWRSEGVFLVFWKTPLKMSLKNLLKIIYVAI